MSSNSLRLADNLKLPLDAVTQTFAILAKRGVGKSYTAAVLAEEMLTAGQLVVIIDPTGAHWGLRSSADGKHAGFPIVVLGGDHGDLPLDEHAGEVVAQSIVEHRFPSIIDLSHFRKGQANRFMTAFLETLYRTNRDALHLIVDEADTFAPQRVMGDEARLCGAMEDCCKKGRIRGLGLTLITQRPAVLNKNVLTQCESLFVLRMTHPKDIGAIREWVGVHSTPDEESRVVADLPSLPIGQAWFWSPGWMQTLKRISIRQRTTFDSGATPKPGQSRRVPKTLADIDLAKLGQKMQASVESVKANDPKELKRRIAELERQVNAKPAAVADQAAIDRAVATAVNAAVAKRDREWQATMKERESVANELVKVVGVLKGRMEKAATLLNVNGEAVAKVDYPKLPTTPISPPAARAQQIKSSRVDYSSSPSAKVVQPGGSLPKGESAVLSALIQFPDGLRREQLTVLTGYKRSSRDTYIQRLRERGLVVVQGDALTASDDGRAALPNAEPLPTGAELQAYWLSRLPEGERAILQVLIDAHPNAVDRSALDDATGYKRSSRDTYLQRLRAKQLIDEPSRGEVRATENLF